VLANELQTVSAHVMGQDISLDHDVQRALGELERVSTSQIPTIASADVVAQVRARLALYQEAVPIVQQMARLTLEE
jgi:hypothetical protein